MIFLDWGYEPCSKNTFQITHANLNVSLSVNPASGPRPLACRHKHRAAGVHFDTIVFKCSVTEFERLTIEVFVIIGILSNRQIGRSTCLDVFLMKSFQLLEVERIE